MPLLKLFGMASLGRVGREGRDPLFPLYARMGGYTLLLNPYHRLSFNFNSKNLLSQKARTREGKGLYTQGRVLRK